MAFAHGANPDKLLVAAELAALDASDVGSCLRDCDVGDFFSRSSGPVTL